jgi:hypothetical protein
MDVYVCERDSKWIHSKQVWCLTSHLTKVTKPCKSSREERGKMRGADEHENQPFTVSCSLEPCAGEGVITHHFILTLYFVTII